MVVGVDGLGDEVGEPGDGVRGLEHLPGVEGGGIREVVFEAVGEVAEDGGYCGGVDVGAEGGFGGEGGEGVVGEVKEGVAVHGAGVRAGGGGRQGGGGGGHALGGSESPR